MNSLDSYNIRKVSRFRSLVLLIILIFQSFSILSNNTADSITLKLYEDSSKYYNNLGREYSFNGNYDSAEYYLKKSLNIKQKYFPHELKKVARAFNNLGAIYYRLWKYENALEIYNKAEDLFIKDAAKFETEIGILEINKGLISLNIGDYQKAKFHFEMALKYLDKTNDTIADYSKTYLLNGFGTLYLRLKDYNNAADYYRECITLSEKINPEILPVAYENLALVYKEIPGYVDKSYFYYKLVINYYKKNKSPTFFQLAIVYNDYAALLTSFGLYKDALKYSYESIKIYEKNYGHLHSEASDAYLTLGNIYLKVENFDSTFFYYQKSIASLVKGYKVSDIYSNPDVSKSISKIYLLKVLKQRASAFQLFYSKTKNNKDLDAALNNYNLAVKLIEQLRLEYQDQNSKLYLSEIENITYDDAEHLAIKLWDITKESKYKEKAFEIAERSKSALLLSAIRDAGAKGFGGIPPELLKKENELTRDIAFYREQIYEESRKESPDSAKLDMWEKLIFNLTNQNEKLTGTFEKEYPKYFALKYNTSVTNIKEINAKLPKDCSLIEYMVSDSFLYIFLIQHNESKIFIKKTDSTFFHSLTMLLKKITKVDPTNHNFRDYMDYYSSATILYDYLIAPIKPRINSNHLIIIPDDILSFVPFEILIPPGDSGEIQEPDYRNLDYLIKDYAISYAYSSTMLFENQWKIKKSAVNSLLAFAPVYHGSDRLSMRGNPRSSYRKDLAPIPGATEEVNQIIRLIHGKAFINESATEKNFKQNAPDYDILHLAMHTVIDNQNPMFSKLVFALSNDSTEDGLLNTYEIFNMSLHARMAVLSSCGSGEGILMKGEGVVSLARGFAYAGCPSLLMTLWEVEDRAGTDLMVDFYKKLRKGYSKDVALQKAKLDFLTKSDQLQAHPFYWSSYICIGDQSAIFSPTKKYFIVAGSILFLSMIGLFIFRYKKRYSD